jgi:hypothetical protein
LGAIRLSSGFVTSSEAAESSPALRASTSASLELAPLFSAHVAERRVADDLLDAAASVTLAIGGA